MDNINNLIKRRTEVDAQNINLKDSDIIAIWDEVACYIDKFMSQSKGVSIPNFGTFTFVQKRIDVGNNKYILVQRPLFAISEKFAQTHGLTYTKLPAAGNIPVHPLNYASIAQETAFSRDDVELCVKHVLQVFNRSVQSKKNVEFTFTNIGKLQIRNNKVKMKFFKEFVNSCDPSGKVLAEMQNRPHTADSVMSRNDFNRPTSKNTCILPRINSRAGALSSMENTNNTNLGAMDTIDEEHSTDPPQVLEIPAPLVTVYSSEDSANQFNNNNNSLEESSQSKEEPKYHIPTAYETQTTASQFLTTKSEPMISSSLTKNEADALNAVLNDNLASSATSSQIFNNVKKLDMIRPSSKTLLRDLTSKKLEVPASPSCGHHNSGQELCYLCHQRQRRNVPVYLHDEMKLKDKEESQLLMQFQHLKDMERQLKDEETRKGQRFDRAKMDAFNLGVSEAIKAKRLERPKTSDIPRSFVFRKRVKTPPKMYRQQELGSYLSMQIDSKNKEVNLAKQELDYIEKMEQLQLAEELAAQREYYLREKEIRKNALKSALDSQVKNKPLELPRALPDSEVFGQYDAKNERLAVMKKKEIETFKFHKDLIEQRKREDLLRQIREQEQDAENIERAKEEYRMDRALRFNRMMEMRKGLESEWVAAHEDKILRDNDEREHRYAHDGNLVHEQCDKYRRCAQCKKDVKNCGESNIWKDTRYTPGSRLMV